MKFPQRNIVRWARAQFTTSKAFWPRSCFSRLDNSEKLDPFSRQKMAKFTTQKGNFFGCIFPIFDKQALSTGDELGPRKKAGPLRIQLPTAIHQSCKQLHEKPTWLAKLKNLKWSENRVFLNYLSNAMSAEESPWWRLGGTSPASYKSSLLLRKHQQQEIIDRENRPFPTPRPQMCQTIETWPINGE